MLFCNGSSLSPSSKDVFLQNLFALRDFPFSLTQHILPLSSIMSHLSRFTNFKELQGEFVRTNSQKYHEPVRKYQFAVHKHIKRIM